MLEILEKKNFLHEAPFSVMQPEIEKRGNTYLPIVPRSSYNNYDHKIWSNGCGEMASDGFFT